MKQRILLIDENREELIFFLDSLKQVPHEDGFKCTYANSTTQAMDMLRLLVPDFIFADLEITGTRMNEFITFITAHPRLQQTKFFLYSAKPEEELKRISSIHGTDIVKKTSSPDTLIKNLCALLSSHSKRQYGFTDW